MHSISATYIKPFIKALANFICVTLLFTTQTAHADFRKALDAYQARDGAIMLKEVKDAVDKKSDDGLMLFLMAMNLDSITTNKQSLSDVSPQPDNSQKKQTTFVSILDESQQAEVNKLLDTAVHNSNIDTRYLYNFKRLSKFTSQNKDQDEVVKELEHLATNGSSDAAVELVQWYGSSRVVLPETAKQWFIKAAELGDTYNSVSLAFIYLGHPASHWLSKRNCEHLKINGDCFERDIKKGSFWLKQAVKNVDKNPVYMRMFALDMGNMLSGHKLDSVKTDYRQAYLWYMLALNSPDFSGNGVSDKTIFNAIKSMHDNNLLLSAAPDLERVWNNEAKRNQVLYPKKLSQLPNLLLQERQQSNSNFNPVFTYLRATDGLTYKLEVFKDGKVKLGLGYFAQKITSNYMKVSPRKVQEFMSGLTKLGVNNWRLSNSLRTDGSYWCNVCVGNDNIFTIRKLGNIASTYYIGYDRNDKVDAKTDIKIAQIFALVEKYFPTELLRCNIGNSETYNRECLAKNQSLIALAKKGE